jgi:hypothetical protein
MDLRLGAQAGEAKIAQVVKILLLSIFDKFRAAFNEYSHEKS